MVVESLVTLGIEHSGDPMQWTPAIVELALTSWLADTVAGPPDEVAAAPDVLRAFVRFCHDEREVPASLRGETVDAVDLWRHAYEARIASESDDDLSEHLVQHWWRRIELLAGEVGDVDVLMGLAVAALPDEPFESAAVTTADGDQVSRLVLLCDRACDTLFDVEHRTACRRLLARAARRGSTVFSGRRDERRMAAAVVYAVGIANRSIGSGRSVLVRDVQTISGSRGACPTSRPSCSARPSRPTAVSPHRSTWGRRSCSPLRDGSTSSPSATKPWCGCAPSRRSSAEKDDRIDGPLPPDPGYASPQPLLEHWGACDS